MKKLMLGLAPLLLVAAFAAMPAMAQAETKEYGTCEKGTPETKPPCAAGEKFVPFGEKRVKVMSKNKAGSVFVLENEAKTADIECSKLQDAGFAWNIKKVGHDHEILVFEECKGSGALKEVCTAANINTSTGAGIIEGVITSENISETETKITIESGFEIVCGTTSFGKVTGSATGKVEKSTNVLKFSKATGLEFNKEKSTITGEDELETQTGGKIFIN
jgi:hypothetical protein